MPRVRVLRASEAPEREPPLCGACVAAPCCLERGRFEGHDAGMRPTRRTWIAEDLVDRSSERRLRCCWVVDIEQPMVFERGAVECRNQIKARDELARPISRPIQCRDSKDRA